MEAIEKWAADEFRSTNGQLQWIIAEALRIDLGAGKGRNWWCVLYPGLCRSACGSYARPAENDLVCGEYILRLRLVEWVQQRTARREDVVLVG